MYLRSLTLKNFRRYTNASFTFSPSINLIFGENAKGKTTLLESIYLLMMGLSFRTKISSEIVQKGQEDFFLEAVFVKHGVEHCLQVMYKEKSKKFFFNRSPLSSLNALFGIIQGVILIPEDISIVVGSPHVRRRFLDFYLLQIDPLYVYHLIRYNRALKQRNILLKRKQIASIESWEEQLATAAVYITKKREGMLTQFEKTSASIFSSLGGKEAMTFSYSPQGKEKQFFLDKYKKLREKEMIMGHTLIGPHKEDFMISLGEKEARSAASYGEQRNIAASLRFTQWKALYDQLEEKPLILLDDVKMGLDKTKRFKWLQCIENFGQVFVTSTEDIDFACAKPVYKISL